MHVNKAINNMESDEFKSLLNQDEVRQSLLVLKNAHQSLEIIIKQMQHSATPGSTHLLEILQSELALIEEELARLDYLFYKLYV